MAQWIKIQLILTLSLFGGGLFSPHAFAGDRQQIQLCEDILTGIHTRYRGKTALNDRTEQSLEQIEAFKESEIHLPARAANGLVNADSHANLVTRSEVASRLEAILADADDNINLVFGDFITGAEAVTRELLKRDRLDDIKAMERGEWTFRSVDFRTTDRVFTQFNASGHWPIGSEDSIEVVTPGLGEKMFGSFFGKVSDLMSSMQNPDNRRDAVVRLDTIVTQDPISGNPLLIDVVRFHRNVPEYDSNSRGRRRRDLSREEELIQFIEENKEQGREVLVDRGHVRRWRP